MPTFHPHLAAHLQSHHGVVDRRTLLDLSITDNDARAMIAAGELVSVADGVYRHAAAPRTFESRCVEWCATDPSVVVGCGGAVRLLQYRGCGHVDVHLLTARPGKPFRHGIKVHRCPVLPDDHVIHRPDGIRLTSPTRTVFDLARHVRWNQLESVIEQGLRRSQFDIQELYAVAHLLCRRGRAGSALFANVLRSRPAWRRPVDSRPELVLLKAMARAGVELRTQPEVHLGGDVAIHPDLGDPGCGFYIEIDDHEWHGGRLDSAYDDRRDRQLRLLGCWVERVSTDDLRPVRPGLIDELVAAYRAQRARTSARHRG